MWPIYPKLEGEKRELVASRDFFYRRFLFFGKASRVLRCHSKENKLEILDGGSGSNKSITALVSSPLLSLPHNIHPFFGLLDVFLFLLLPLRWNLILPLPC